MEIFIIGLLFGCVILPLLDGLISLVLAFFEMIKSYITVKIVTNNQKINPAGENEQTQAIGFVYREEEQEDDI